MNVFDLFAKISLDTSAYESALNGAKGMASGFGSTLTSVVGQAVDFVKTSLETAGRATAAFIGDSIQTGREFDQAMSQVAATMGTSVGEIENLRDFAREMGASTAFSATEAAEALNYMALAGYDAETSMSMLPNVLNLAAAGNIVLARADYMVTATLTAFCLSLERTTQMVDGMAKAASTGNTNVEQLGDAFLTVGGLAQELNGGFVTLEDGTQAEVDGLQELEIALTSMANAGVKGSEAGTHMRNMLLKLTSPTAEGAEQFERLGVKVFDAGGKMRSLKDIFGDLNTSLGRLTQQEKLQAVSELFNARDTASAEALLNAIGEDWDHIGESILDAKGAAEEMAETQLDNLEGDITKFKSALDEAKISISDRLSPALRDLVQTGTRELGHLAEAFQGNGFRGLFTVIRLDIEQAQRHVSEFVSGIDFAGMAREAGEKAPQVIASMLEAWTNPERKQPFLDAGFAIINGLTDGLLSDESFDKFVETAPKVIDNLAEGIKRFLNGERGDGEGGLIGATKKVVQKISDYMSVEDNRRKLYKAAEDILKTLGQFLVDNVRVLVPFMIELTAAMASMIFDMLNDALMGLLNSDYKLGSAGRYSNAIKEQFLRANTDIADIDDWISAGMPGLEEPTAASLNNALPADIEATAQGMRMSGIPAAAIDQYISAARRRGYATGGVIDKPTYALIGEDGAEAVMPLEKNTGWIDQLAERLGGGGVVIQFGDIHVNGKEEVGREVVAQIDTALRQYQIMQQRGVGGTGWA